MYHKLKKELVQDITREKLYLYYNKEIPYLLTVETKFWFDKNNILIIHQNIVVLKESHKKIILGARGLGIKNIKVKASYAIKKLLKKEVYLYLFVKFNKK